MISSNAAVQGDSTVYSKSDELQGLVSTRCVTRFHRLRNKRSCLINAKIADTDVIVGVQYFNNNTSCVYKGPVIRSKGYLITRSPEQ